MQFINIFPAEDAIKYNQPIEMYLAHILDNSEICEAIKAKESFKILDNGCYELDSSIDFAELMRKAEAIGADEVILPDVMFDADKTIELVLNALTELHKMYGSKIPFGLMAVVQGRDVEDYTYCAQVFSKFPEITTLGIPKKFLRENGDDTSTAIKALERGNFARYLKETYPEKNIHLLGLSWGIMELKYSMPYVRSIDTNFVVEISKTGFTGSIWDTWKTFGEVYTLDTPLTDNMWTMFRRNKQDVEEYLNGRND